MDTSTSDKKDKIEIEFLEKVQSLAKQRYEQELAREESLISQAARMQTAVSIFSTAIFALLPSIIHSNYRGTLTLTFIYIFISIISFLLVVSLLFSTLAQGRWKVEMFISTQGIKEEILGNQLKDFLNDHSKYLSAITYNYLKACDSISENNKKRVRYIGLSTWSFYISILSCFFFWISATIILYS